MCVTMEKLTLMSHSCITDVLCIEMETKIKRSHTHMHEKAHIISYICIIISISNPQYASANPYQIGKFRQIKNQQSKVVFDYSQNFPRSSFLWNTKKRKVLDRVARNTDVSIFKKSKKKHILVKCLSLERLDRFQCGIHHWEGIEWGFKIRHPPIPFEGSLHAKKNWANVQNGFCRSKYILSWTFFDIISS